MVTLAAALVGSPANPASAADNGQWAVYPTTVSGQRPRPYFQPLLTPGVSINDSFTITNKTSAPLNLNLYAADAFNTRDGIFASTPPNIPPRDMGSWISLPVDNVTVPASTAVAVPFTMSPPPDATPGDHPGSIVAVNTVPSISHSGNINTRTLQGVGTRVYGRVVGPLKPSLAVTQLTITAHRGVGGQAGANVSANVTYQVVNSGNVRLTPTAKLSVSPLVGSSTTAKPLALPELLPRGSALVHQSVSGLLPVGRLKAHVDVTSPAASTSAESSTLVIPWLLLLLLALIIGGVWYWRRRRSQQLDAAADWTGIEAVKTG
jgi:hypothetical protein